MKCEKFLSSSLVNEDIKVGLTLCTAQSCWISWQDTWLMLCLVSWQRTSLCRSVSSCTASRTRSSHYPSRQGSLKKMKSTEGRGWGRGKMRESEKDRLRERRQADRYTCHHPRMLGEWKASRKTCEKTPRGETSRDPYGKYKRQKTRRRGWRHNSGRGHGQTRETVSWKSERLQVNK